MESPWLSLAEAATYAKRGKRFLRKEVQAGRLRAAVCGGRRELFLKREFIDQWFEDQAMPVVVSSRRRA
jgi:hypothetical protein